MAFCDPYTNGGTRGREPRGAGMKNDMIRSMKRKMVMPQRYPVSFRGSS